MKEFIMTHSIKGQKATWLLFALVFLFLLIKTSIFHLFVFPGEPFYFFAKIYVPLFLAFFVLITERKYWTLVIFLIIDFWIIVNTIYFRANNIILTDESILMAENLQGFESSIGFYWNWKSWCYLLLTFLYGLSLPFLHPQPQKKGAGIVASIVIICFVIDSYYLSKDTPLSAKERYKYYIPFYGSYEYRHLTRGMTFYAEQRTIVAYLPMVVNTLIVDAFREEEKLELKAEEESRIADFIHPNGVTHITPTSNLMFILVESLETFPLHMQYEGKYYMPNMHRLLEKQDVLFADKIKSQVRHGVSSDGQLIYNTGLLPIQNSAAAMYYEKNTYPNYAQFYDKSILSNPVFDHVWNQYDITKAFGYKTTLGGDCIVKDEVTFERILPTWTNNVDTNICYLAITYSSHSPFRRVASNPTLSFDEDMPKILRDYLTCLHYVDSCFGEWYGKWKETEMAHNTVLVIASDHSVFKQSLLQEILPYIQKINLSIASAETFCPLIIQTPQIMQNIYIPDTCYQMDIYSTILSLIGAEQYYWQGFGVNLLDSVERKQRKITEDEAYLLSDKLIRSNYFSIWE